MENTQDALSNASQSAGEEITGTRKAWETPKLRILPVPTKTQGGAGDVEDQDDVFYRKS